MTKLPAKQAEPAQRSRAEPPLSRSPERRPEGNQRPQAPSPSPRTSARPPEREPRTERPAKGSRADSRQPLRGWQSQEELTGSQGSHRHLERSWSSHEKGPGPESWRGLGESSLGAAGALEETWRGLPREYRESWGQPEAWKEEPPSNGLQEPLQKPAQRGWGSLQELSSPHQPVSPPESSWAGPEDFSHPPQPETPTALGWRAEGACPHLPGPERPPELDWRDLLGLLREPGEGAWARLPRLDWEGLLELLQARLPHKDPPGHWGDPARTSGPELVPPGTEDAPEPERHSQPKDWMEATQVNGHGPGQRPQSPAQPPCPACTSTSTQWPKTKVTSGLETSTLGDPEQIGRLGSSSPADADGPSPPELEVSLSLLRGSQKARPRPDSAQKGFPVA